MARKILSGSGKPRLVIGRRCLFLLPGVAALMVRSASHGVFTNRGTSSAQVLPFDVLDTVEYELRGETTEAGSWE